MTVTRSWWIITPAKFKHHSLFLLTHFIFQIYCHIFLLWPLFRISVFFSYFLHFLCHFQFVSWLIAYSWIFLSVTWGYFIWSSTHSQILLFPLCFSTVKKLILVEISGCRICTAKDVIMPPLVNGFSPHLNTQCMDNQGSFIAFKWLEHSDEIDFSKKPSDAKKEWNQASHLS